MGSTIEKASICFRIGTTQWLPDDRYEPLLRLFEKYKGVTDEVTFFTSETHPPLPLEVIRQRGPILAKRMEAARKLGYRSGVNILSTFGHHNENLPNSLSTDYTRMTDLDGRTCAGSFCPNDERMRGYIREIYQIITQAKPDYIWIDDDVRLMGHMPIRCGCFCDRCLKIYEEQFGTRYTRPSLEQAFDTGPVDKRIAVRKTWLEHNRRTIADVFRLIEKTVHDIQPGLPLGFMTGDRFFEGYDFDTWAGVLAGPGKAPVLWRPGGGQYTDESLDGIAQKAHQMGRQTAFLPPTITTIQSELESFPYQRLKKSAQATVMEAASYIAGGCTGTAFNVLSMYSEPLDEYEPLVARIRQARPFLDILAKTFGRNPARGVYTGWTKDSLSARNPEGSWLSSWGDPGTHHADELFATGIPSAYLPQHSSAAVISADSVLAMKKEEIERLLSGGVYMDPQAMIRLNQMGYQELTGFGVERVLHDDCIEQMVVHPLNAGLAGRRRDGRQSFWKCPAYALSRVNPQTQILTRIIDYTSQQVAACCMGVFENKLGGRVCVAGYYPWAQSMNNSRTTQLKSVFRWLSKDTLPAYVASFHKANVWVRSAGKSDVAIALVNSYLDPAERVVLHVLTGRDRLAVVDMSCRSTEVTSAGTDGPYKVFALPTIRPWEMVMVQG